jgi:septum formation protein
MCNWTNYPFPFLTCFTPNRMIVDILEKINKKSIILASSSPRRKEILEQIGLLFKIKTSSFDEKTIDKKKFETPSEFVKYSSLQKALHVFETFEKVKKFIKLKLKRIL